MGKNFVFYNISQDCTMGYDELINETNFWLDNVECPEYDINLK